MTSSSPDINPTQLLRYTVQIADLNTPERISEVREQLTSLGLLVDRIDQGEVEVAVSQAANPGADGIQETLEAAGFSVTNIQADAS
ncbi:hypothetical protein [uncultured Hymenobacter sp.]|uniref:hypothetical protein n=1 Tax=uncultured Hymenobacter sp. TaxID=170016 RepID=UPI0035C946D6